MLPGRVPAAVPDRRPDSGFTLVEIVVSLAVLSLVMAATSVFFTRTLRTTHLVAQQQQAVQLTADGLETVRALAATALVARRGQAAVQAQWNAAPAPVASALSTTQPVWDTTVATTSGATAPLPTSAVTSGGYTRQWYLGSCWLLSGGTDCNVTNQAIAGSFDMYRVLVAVSWPDNQCSAGVCWVTRSTLVATDDTEPVFSAVAVVPVPVVPAAIWASNGTNGGTTTSVLSMINSQMAVTGLVHSSADAYITNTNGTMAPQLEVGTILTKTNATGLIITATTYGATGSPPGARAVADYRPGGSAATAAGTGFKQAPCSSGSWTYNPAQVTGATIVYANCAVTIGSNNVTAATLVVAEGAITVTGNNTIVGSSTSPATTGLLTASTATPAITIGGASTKVYGSIQAPAGNVLVQSSQTLLQCGIIGDTVKFNNASSLTITADSSCS